MTTTDSPATVTVTHTDGTTETFPIEQVTPDNECQWFANCTRDATSLMNHPILGIVPICDTCRAQVIAFR